MAQRRVLAPAEPAELNLDLAGWYRRGGRRCTVHVTAEEFAAVAKDRAYRLETSSQAGAC